MVSNSAALVYRSYFSWLDNACILLVLPSECLQSEPHACCSFKYQMASQPRKWCLHKCIKIATTAGLAPQLEVAFILLLALEVNHLHDLCLTNGWLCSQGTSVKVHVCDRCIKLARQEAWLHCWGLFPLPKHCAVFFFCHFPSSMLGSKAFGACTVAETTESQNGGQQGPVKHGIAQATKRRAIHHQQEAIP